MILQWSLQGGCVGRATVRAPPAPCARPVPPPHSGATLLACVHGCPCELEPSVACLPCRLWRGRWCGGGCCLFVGAKGNTGLPARLPCPGPRTALTPTGSSGCWCPIGPCPFHVVVLWGRHVTQMCVGVYGRLLLPSALCLPSLHTSSPAVCVPRFFCEKSMMGLLVRLCLRSVPHSAVELHVWAALEVALLTRVLFSGVHAVCVCAPGVHPTNDAHYCGEGANHPVGVHLDAKHQH